MRADLICPGFVRTPLVDLQMSAQALALGISGDDVVSKVMLTDSVNGEFTSVDDVAQTALFLASSSQFRPVLASFPGIALTGQSIVVSHGWLMQ